MTDHVVHEMNEGHEQVAGAQQPARTTPRDGDAIKGLVPIDIATIEATAMTAAITTADQTGDMTPVWTLVEHLQSPNLSRDHVLAIALFTLSMNAAKSRDHGAERRFLQTMREHCTRRAIDNAVIGVVLSTGGKQGWLDATAYDDLAERVARLRDGHPARVLFAVIERRQRPRNH